MALVSINREKLGAPGDFMSLSKTTLYKAIEILSHSELRLFLYLVSNKDGYAMPFSKQLIQNEIGLSKNGFYLARDGLIKKGYLYFDEVTGNYSFYERSLKTEF